MTTVITRLYADKATAEAVVAALDKAGIDGAQVIASADMAAMKAAQIEAVSAKAYGAAMTGGQALVVVSVGFNPVGAARKAVKIVSRTASINVGLAEEEAYYEGHMDAVHMNRVLEGGPLIMSNPFARFSHGHILGNNPIIPSGPRSSAIRGGGFMSRGFWPMKLVSTGRQSRSAIAGGRLFSQGFGLPLLINH